jgi:uncharacterized membrane protein
MFKKIQRFNARLALAITNAVGSMWCAYAFTLLALISLPEAVKGGTGPLIAWIAQTFLQLVLLSIIMVGQDVASQKTEKRAEQDHEMIKKILKAEFEANAEMVRLLREDLAESKKLNEKIDHLDDEVEDLLG